MQCRFLGLRVWGEDRSGSELLNFLVEIIVLAYLDVSLAVVRGGKDGTQLVDQRDGECAVVGWYRDTDRVVR